MTAPKPTGKPFPGPLQRKWRKDYGAVRRDLLGLRDRIDQLGTDGEGLVFKATEGWREPDEIGCFASNSIEGTLSLLEELWQRVVSNGDPRR